MSRDCTEPRSTLPTSSAATAMNNMATFLAIARWQLRLPQLRAGASRLGAAPSHNLANVQCRNLSNVQLCNPANVQLCKLANVQCRQFNCEHGHFSRDCPQGGGSSGCRNCGQEGHVLGLHRAATLPTSSAATATNMATFLATAPRRWQLRLPQLRPGGPYVSRLHRKDGTQLCECPVPAVQLRPGGAYVSGLHRETQPCQCPVLAVQLQWAWQSRDCPQGGGSGCCNAARRVPSRDCTEPNVRAVPQLRRIRPYEQGLPEAARQ